MTARPQGHPRDPRGHPGDRVRRRHLRARRRRGTSFAGRRTPRPHRDARRSNARDRVGSNARFTEASDGSRFPNRGFEPCFRQMDNRRETRRSSPPTKTNPADLDRPIPNRPKPTEAGTSPTRAARARARPARARSPRVPSTSPTSPSSTTTRWAPASPSPASPTPPPTAPSRPITVVKQSAKMKSHQKPSLSDDIAFFSFLTRHRAAFAPPLTSRRLFPTAHR